MSSSLFAPLRDFYGAVMATASPNVPPCDPMWLVYSFVFNWALFFLLPAGPWMPTEAEWASMSSKPFNRRKESVRIRNGLVSAIHAMVTTGTVLLWLTQYTFEAWNPQRNMGGGFITPNNANGDAWLPMLVSYTVGYFTYDTICMMVYPHVASVGSYVHHIAIGLAMACGLTSGIGRFYHFIFLWEEISTLPLNLKALNRHRPAAHKFYSGAFVVLFMLSRGVIGLSMSAATYYCIGKFWLDHHVQMNSYLFTLQVFLQFFGFTSSRVLNIYWMYLIANIVRHGKGGKKKETKKVE